MLTNTEVNTTLDVVWILLLILYTGCLHLPRPRTVNYERRSTVNGKVSFFPITKHSHGGTDEHITCYSNKKLSECISTEQYLIRRLGTPRRRSGPFAEAKISFPCHGSHSKYVVPNTIIFSENLRE
jgi:hypothetical protein